MGLRNGLILLLGLLLLSAGCSSEISSGLSGSDGFEQVSTNPESLCPTLSSSRPPELSAARSATRGSSFTIPEGTVSFSIAVLGSSATMLQLIQPSGQDLFRLMSPNCSDTFGAFEQNWGGFSAFPLPVTQGTLPEAGPWRVEYWGDSEPFIFTRQAPLQPTATLTVRPYLTGTQYSASDLDAALAVMTRIFQINDITIDLKAVTSLDNDSRFTTVRASFQDSDTGALVTNGQDDGVNLFFVEDFSNQTYLGMASGIPGTLGLKGSFNGVLLSLAAHSTGSGLDEQLLGETAAHETGHFLGLYHTSESNGFEHDPLSDTPECDQASSGASACDAADGSNLMFWASYSTLDRNNGKVQETLSAQQRFVLRASPLAR